MAERGIGSGLRAARERIRRPRADEPEPLAEPLAEAPADQRYVADEQDATDERDEPPEHADPSEVGELVEQIQRLIASRRPPDGPITQPWSLGVGDVFAEHPKVPKKVRGLVRRLDRLGGLRVTPEEIAFDGDDVPWAKVTEVRTRHLVDYVFADAVQRQVESIPLPWFPGRRRLLDAFGQAMLTATIVTVKSQLERLDADLRIPAELEYRGALGRRKELGAGVLAAVVLADPAVNQAVVATARARGVPVRASGDEMLSDAESRAAAMRQKIAGLEAELDRFNKRFGRAG
jgi:hypothetical protein